MAKLEYTFQLRGDKAMFTFEDNQTYADNYMKYYFPNNKIISKIRRDWGTMAQRPKKEKKWKRQTTSESMSPNGLIRSIYLESTYRGN